MDEASVSVSNRPLAQSLPASMQTYIWHATLPLAITHASSVVPYLLHVPRLSYLPLVLPRLNLFFGPGIVGSSFSHHGRALPNLPIGLLFDIFAPPLPWALELGNSPVYETHDTFINSLKEVSTSEILPSSSSLLLPNPWAHAAPLSRLTLCAMARLGAYWPCPKRIRNSSGTP